MAKLHRSQFLKDVKAEFPELRQELNSEYGLLHLEMHVFCDHTNRAIGEGARDTVIKCFQIADRFIQGGNARLVNAFAVSYLEHLDFEDGEAERSWAKALMPASVASSYDEITEYNRKLFECRSSSDKEPTP